MHTNERLKTFYMFSCFIYRLAWPLKAQVKIFRNLKFHFFFFKIQIFPIPLIGSIFYNLIYTYTYFFY